MNKQQAPSRILSLAGEVSWENMRRLVTAIEDINAFDDELESSAACDPYISEVKRLPVKLMIDSVGGYVHPAIGLINVILSSKTPVDTYVTGMAASAASLISICGRKRYCYRYSTYMFHNLAGGMVGDLQSQEESMEESKRLQDQIVQITAAYSGFTKKDLMEIYKKKRDMYYDATQALNMRFVDEVIEPLRTGLPKPPRKPATGTKPTPSKTKATRTKKTPTNEK